MHNHPVLAKAAQPATPVNFEVPAGACDCHTHIHGDPEKFPFFAGRVYTPEPASPEEMAALHKALHMQRVVIVTPSVYGTDNSATLYGMKARGADARGVAVIDDKTSESELDAMRPGRHPRHQAQSRDRRHQRSRRSDAQRFQAAVERVKARNWHVQMYTQSADDLRRSRISSPLRRCRSCSIISAARRPRSASSSRALPTWSSWCSRARPT